MRCPPRRWLQVGKLEASRAQLCAEIAFLRREASRLNHPATFSKCAKLQRMANAKEKELAALGSVPTTRAYRIASNTVTQVGGGTAAAAVRACACWAWLPRCCCKARSSQPHGGGLESQLSLAEPRRGCPGCCAAQVVCMALGFLFWTEPVAYIPRDVSGYMGRWLALARWGSFSPVGSVAAMPWLVLCSSASGAAVRAVLPKLAPKVTDPAVSLGLQEFMAAARAGAT